MRFNTFRNNSIRTLLHQPKVDSIETALSLNGIIHLANEYSKCYGFEVDVWENICTAAKSRANSFHTEEEIPGAGLLIVKATVELFKSRCKTKLSTASSYTRDLTAPYINESRSSIVTNTCKMLLNYSERMNYNWNPTLMSDSFKVNVFDPVFDPFFRGIGDTINHGADHFLTESVSRKKELALQFNESLAVVSGRKPGKSLQWHFNNRKQYHICLVEIKIESTAKGRPDLVKLGTMLKDCLDSMLNNSLKRQKCFIFGMLQECRRCTLYSLYSPSNYFYAMQELDICFMTSNCLNAGD